MKKKIAITGGIGSGKSTVLREISKRGYPVFSCDEIYKEVLLSPAYIQEIQKNFPECIKEGQIDRQILSDIIFQNEDKRQTLNQIAHPLIMSTLLARMENTPSDLIFAEVPLLFEGNFEKLFDRIIVVLRNEEERINALIQRDGTTKEQIKNRINAQFDYFSKQATQLYNDNNAFILENQGDVEGLKEKISKLIKVL